VSARSPVAPAATPRRFRDKASSAQWHAERRARRPKTAKLVANDKLREYVQERLEGAVAEYIDWFNFDAATARSDSSRRSDSRPCTAAPPCPSNQPSGSSQCPSNPVPDMVALTRCSGQWSTSAGSYRSLAVLWRCGRLSGQDRGRLRRRPRCSCPCGCGWSVNYRHRPHAAPVPGSRSATTPTAETSPRPSSQQWRTRLRGTRTSTSPRRTDTQ
jgi:hypothetical protein